MNEDPIRDGLNWYAYVSNNPVRFIDPLGLKAGQTHIGKEAANAMGIKSGYYDSNSLEAQLWKGINGLRNTIFSQYDTEIRAIASGTSSAAGLTRMSYNVEGSSQLFAPARARFFGAIKSILNNKEHLFAAEKEFSIPATLLAGIILKEQFTRSIPDSLSPLANEIVRGDNTRATLGLGANSIFGSTPSWEWWGSQGGDIPDFLYDNAKMIKELRDNDGFNIRTSAVILRYIAEGMQKMDMSTVGTWGNAEWREVLYGYNTEKEYDYADKVLEYIPYMETILYVEVNR